MNRKNNKNDPKTYLHTAYDELFKDFKPGLAPKSGKDEGFWFIFKGSKLLVIPENNGEVSISSGNCPVKKTVLNIDPLFLGEYKGKNCFAVSCADTALPYPGHFEEMLPLFQKLPAPFFALAGLASQLLHWAHTSRFCGVCGAETSGVQNERAKKCTACNELYYPRVTPAVIVAVTKKNSLLLAWSQRWTQPVYSVLAGFVEPGETLIQTVRREVKEETNIEIKNISFFGSQPWPFPAQLMIAYTAEWESGEIKVDTDELRQAMWVTREELKALTMPGPISIARELIDWFISEH